MTPAELKTRNYRDSRSSQDFTKYHEWTRANRPDWVYTLVRVLITLPILVLYRPRTAGIEHVPTQGPVLLVPNHLSHMDHFFVGFYLKRKLNFIGKSQLFANRLFSFVLNHGGVFPIRRGHSDEQAFKTAHIVLERGSPLLIYPEGGRSRSGRPARARPGVGRLALESGVPVIPVTVHGTNKIGEWRRGHFPTITIIYGEPLRFDRVERPDREQQEAAANEIFGHVIRTYNEIERDGSKVVRARYSVDKPS